VSSVVERTKFRKNIGLLRKTRLSCFTADPSSRNRVEISVLKNNLDQLASTSSNASAPPK
jgi:hypothetical protein